MKVCRIKISLYLCIVGRQTPQHKYFKIMLLGSNQNYSALELLLSADLMWSVVKDPLIGQSTGIESETFSLVREDTQKELGTCKAGYEVFQNSQLADLILEVAHTTTLPIHSAGFLGKGEKVYIQLKSADLHMKNDTVKGYLTVVNSFDGSTALGIGNSTFTISCSNTYFSAYKALVHKIKHTASLLLKVEDLMQSLDATVVAQNKHFELISKLATAPMTDAAAHAMYKLVGKVDFADLKAHRANPDSKLISTRKLNAIERLEASIIGEIATKDRTLWGLFSGVTHYTTNVLKNEEAKMFGGVAQSERMLLDVFADMVK